MNALTTGLNLKQVLEHFEVRKEEAIESMKNIQSELSKFDTLKSIYGAYSPSPYKHNDIPYVKEKDVIRSVTISAWHFVYDKAMIKHIAPQTHLKHFENLLESPPEFTMENLFDVFGEYVKDPRGMSLQAFAEVFSSLDKFYKSHDRFGVGKKGLPKRVIIENCGEHASAWGWKKVADVINVLMRYRGQLDKCVTEYEAKDLVEYGEEYVEALRLARIDNKFNNFPEKERVEKPTFEGLSFKQFGNGNVHIIFDKKAMDDTNLCLAEYYGEVLPDAWEHTDKPSESKEVSKDLQFYKTPQKTAKKFLNNTYIDKKDKILEPSCGDGALLDALVKEGVNKSQIIGVEFDGVRAMESRSKGYTVYRDNFLTWETDRKFDKIVANPPFYGKHYMKHIKRALELLEDDGVAYFILPATARYDHGLIDNLPNYKTWCDLDLGSFRESGTNVNTTMLTIRK